MIARLLLLLFVCLGCAGQEPISEPKPIEVTGMNGSTQVGDVLIGGQPSAAGLQELAALGYHTVISTRPESETDWDEAAKADSLGLHFVRIPMSPPVVEITDEQVARFADLMENATRPIVMHCGSGNRVSGLWAVWLVEHEKLPPERALELAEKTGMRGVRKAVEARLKLKRE